MFLIQLINLVQPEEQGDESTGVLMEKRSAHHIGSTVHSMQCYSGFRTVIIKVLAVSGI